MPSGTRWLAWRSAARAGVSLAWILWLPATATAADSFLATSFFAKGLGPDSSWAEILRTPEIAAEFPQLGFGTAFVPLTRLCLEGGALRPLEAPSRGEPGPGGGARWVVSVYRVVAVVPVVHRVFLFAKVWEVPPCPRP